MDRILKYPKTLVLDTDFLLLSKNAMLGIGKAFSCLMNNTSQVAHGLAGTQTTVPSLSITIGPGQVYNFVPIDATAYGALAADTTHSVMKQAINLDSVNVGPFAVPVTGGQSANHLVQAQYVETDSGSQVLAYYNSANPTQPQSGPNNTGTAQPTVRGGTIVFQIKAGTPAATGAQVTPAPDAGWIGLWVVTVANGAATIVNANISAYNNSASFFQGFVPFIGGTMLGLLNLFAGSTVPTAAPGDNSTKIINSAFLVNALLPYAPLASPALTGTPTTPTPAPGDNSTKISSTAFVNTALTPYAPLASPGLTGNPTAPTAAVGDNDTSIATTAFAQAVGIKAGQSLSFGSNTTLTAAQAGSIVEFSPGGGIITCTLPAVSAVVDGAGFLLKFLGAGGTTVNRAGADVINFNGTNVTTFSLINGDWAWVYKANGHWAAMGIPGLMSSATFAALFASAVTSNGYMLNPNGVMVQWFFVTAGANTFNQYTFPNSFPTACFGLVALPAFNSGGTGPTQFNGSVDSPANTKYKLGNNGTVSTSFFVIAIGN